MKIAIYSHSKERERAREKNQPTLKQFEQIYTCTHTDTRTQIQGKDERRCCRKCGKELEFADQI